MYIYSKIWNESPLPEKIWPSRNAVLQNFIKFDNIFYREIGGGQQGMSHFEYSKFGKKREMGGGGDSTPNCE